ncbi:MAG: hypothetical protein WBD95_26975 [Xanthobacteraceae bacterium]
MVRTTKKLSALRQILMAIKCIDSVDYECAITLAGAAEGQIDEKQIPEGTRPHLFRVLRAKFAPEPVNEDVTWMKHPSGAFDRDVTQFDVALTIARAIQKYVATYQETHVRFEEFSQWAVMKKHIPRPLTEKASEAME